MEKKRKYKKFKTRNKTFKKIYLKIGKYNFGRNSKEREIPKKEGLSKWSKNGENRRKSDEIKQFQSGDVK